MLLNKNCIFVGKKFIMDSTVNMNKAADNIRILAASMVEKARSGHPGRGDGWS